jgi:predicted DNA-binding transcriptional regulator YafY
VKRNSIPKTRTSNGGKLPDFIRDGLEAHRRASRNVKANALKQLGKPKRDRTILAAIKNKEVLRFKYNGKERIVEPQTYGISIAGREVLRAHQIGRSGSGPLRMAKLFDLEKISNLRKAGTVFGAALRAHNPKDSAMVEVFATLPKPKK